MLFRVSGRGRRRMAVARLGDAGRDAPRLRRSGRLLVLPLLRLRALLLRSRLALARLRDWYADVVRGLVADAAAAEAPVKARRTAEEARAGGTVAAAPKPAPVVVPAAVAGGVLRCNAHRYIR